jgi:sterol desaturase/sphingolipid hydroxylase (fatty acid hydroxylase superfamily)
MWGRRSSPRAGRPTGGGDLTVLAIPLFLAAIATEWALLRRRKWADPDEAAAAGVPNTGGSTTGNSTTGGSTTGNSNTERPLGYDARDTVASLAMGVGMLLVNAGVGRLLAPGMHWLHEHRMLHLGGRPDPVTGRTPRRALLAAVLLWDFAFYWEHRLSHEHRVMWAAHVNHHSSRYFNLSTALRQSWTGFVGDWVYAPLVLLGFSPAQVARAAQLDLLYQFWVHTELVERLPRWAEWVLSTPAHHRVHHGSNPRYLDRNYGGILIVWDRLFGTFAPAGERVRYGLTTDITTVNPFRIAFHEWAALARDVIAAPSWQERFRYAAGPPGWAPSASRHLFGSSSA